MKNAGNGSIIHPFARTKMNEMKVFLKGAAVFMFTAAAFLCFSLFPQAAKAAAYGTNLVLNGNAQASDTELLGWTKSGSVFMILTPASGWIVDPYSTDGGNVFDFYPISSAAESIYQIIDISNMYSDIDAGIVNIHVNAETRKYMPSSSNIVKLELLSGSNAVLATYQAIGTTVNSKWDTLAIDQTSIAAGTRSVRITLSATITDITNSDYVEFDGISLTLTKAIPSAAVTGIVAPATGELPITYTSLTPGSSDYTVTGLTWENWNGLPAQYMNGRFRASNTYRALIELTANPLCKFTQEDALSVNTGTPQPGTISGGDVTGNKLTFAVTFPATAELSATNITTVSQPNLLSYIEGQALNLSGLNVTLTYNDTSTVGVTPDQFTLRGITASPANGTILTLSNHGQQVSLTANGHTSYTSALTVVPATYTISAPPTPMDFGSAVAGYIFVPAARAVTILNTGNSTLTLTQPDSTDYVLGELSSTSLNAGDSATFTVQPKMGLAAGVHSETVTVNTDHGTSAGVFVTYTVHSPTYTIALGPDSLDFGSIVEGYVSPPMSRMVTIFNTGNSPVTISTAPTATGYTVTGAFPITIEAGGANFFFIQPAMSLAPGIYNETLTLLTDQGTSASMDLRLTVEDAVYSITASSSIDLGSAVEGSPFSPMGTAVLMHNTGNAPVTIASAPVSTDFRMMSTFPMTIESGRFSFILIEPISGLAPGVHVETLVFQTEQGASASVEVSFTVQAATYTVQADTDSLSFLNAVEGYAFAPAAQPVTIYNRGNSNVTINIPASINFDITLMGPMALLPAGSTLFLVQPKTGLAAGTYNETITFSTTSGTSDSVNVSFTVQAPTYTVEADTDCLNFLSVVEGYAAAPAAQTVTITNRGNSAVTFSTAPAASDYDIIGPFPVTIPAGFFFTFGVQPKAGLAAGLHIQTITLSTDRGTSVSLDLVFTVNAAIYTITASPASPNFGSVIEGYPAAPASQAVTVTNTGNSIVTISSAPMAAAYDITGIFPMTIVAGGTGTFNIQPKLGLVPGTHNWTIAIIADHSASASVNASFTVQTASYAVEADTHGVSFLSIVEGYAVSPAAQTVTITNMGNKDVTLTTPTSTHFDITALDPLTLAPAAAARFTVQPKAGLSAGTFNETIAFSTTSLTYDSVNVSFTVQTASYAITASPFTINFASAAEGYTLPAAETVTIVNTGNQPVTLVQPTSANFTAGTLSKLSIAPLEEAAFTLQPKIGLAEGSYSETIVIQGSHGTASSVEARFTVTAAPSYAIDASPSGLVFESLAQGYIQPAVKFITVTNTGNQSISLYQPAASHFEIGTLSKTALAPLDTATFTVTPKAGLLTGAWNETVQIIGSHGVNARVDAAFTCTEPNGYVILSGDGSTFQQDEPEPSSLTITANGHLSNFTGLTLNGELVDESNYDVAEGSTIVTLHQDFLDTLTPGTYTLRFHYTDGFADAGFVVQDQMPVTGDNGTLILFGSLMVLSLAAIMLLKRKQAQR